MNLYHLKNQNRAYNLDHIEDVMYGPAGFLEEDDDGVSGPYESWIHLWFSTSHEMVSHRGEEADALWEYIKRNSGGG